MALYPHAKHLLVGGHDGPMSDHLGACIHVNESNGNLDGWVADHSHDMSCHLEFYKDGSCLAPEHRVLTADLQWVAGGDLCIGDRLIAFDESGAGRTSGRCYREAIVESIEEAVDELFAVVFDDETKIYATADHRWLTQFHQTWSWHKTINSDTGRSIKGAQVPQLLQPWTQRSNFEAGWFTGILDGEGSLSPRHILTVAQNPTMVLDRMLRYLKTEGYDVSDALSKSDAAHRVSVRGGLATSLELIGSHRPYRLLDKVNIERFGGLRRNSNGMRKVVAVYSVGTRPIVKIQTSTRTFIAEGFGMHNCTEYVDCDYSSWCQMAGNPWYLSAESEGFHTEPFTEGQLNGLGHFLVWAHRTYGIPLQLANTPGERGLIYHGAGGDAWGGHPDCAGTPRDNARPEIIRRAKNILAGKHPVTGQEQDMARFVASDKTHRVYLVKPGEAVEEIHGRANVAVFAGLYGIDPTIHLVKHADLELAATRFGAGAKAHL